MAALDGHRDLDQNLDLDLDLDLDQENRCQSTGDPQLDQAVRQWLSWDKVNVCWGSRHQTSCQFLSLFYNHAVLITNIAPTGSG